MLSLIPRWFRPAKAQPIAIFRGLLEAMDRKDHALRVELGPMKPSAAAKRWREVYPEDFADGRLVIVEQSDRRV